MMNKNVLVIMVLLAGWFLFPGFYDGKVLAKVAPSSEYSSEYYSESYSYAENEPTNEPESECTNEENEESGNTAENEDGSECTEDSECNSCEPDNSDGECPEPSDSECESEEADSEIDDFVDEADDMDCSEETADAAFMEKAVKMLVQGSTVTLDLLMSPTIATAQADSDGDWAQKCIENYEKWNGPILTKKPADDDTGGFLGWCKKIKCKLKGKKVSVEVGKFTVVDPADCKCKKCQGQGHTVYGAALKCKLP